MDELSDFLEQKKKEEEENGNKYATEKEKWISDVNRLFDQIREWTKNSKEKDLLKISQNIITISEKNFGTYEIPRLSIKSLGRNIIIQPVARYIVGGEGRIDILHGGETHKLIKKNDEWNYIDPQASSFLQQFTKERFIELLKSLI